MPRLSVYFIRASLIYLLLGLTVGGVLLVNKGTMFMPMVWAFLPVHIEFSFTGWMVQLALGVAFWILPRFSTHPIRGNERLSWISFFFLNAGIWLVILQSLAGSNWLTFTGRVFEVFAVVLFVIGNWKRVKPLGL